MIKLVIKSVLGLLALLFILFIIENYDSEDGIYAIVGLFEDGIYAIVGLFIVLVLRFRFYPFIFKRKE
jgi:hypothetical protein